MTSFSEACYIAILLMLRRKHKTESSTYNATGRERYQQSTERAESSGMGQKHELRPHSCEGNL